MKGQWRGQSEGTNPGQIVVEIDDLGGHFEGCAYLYERDPALPSVFASIKTPNKETTFKFQAPVMPLHPEWESPTTFAQIADRFPDVTFPDTADIQCDWTDATLSVSWTTNVGTHGSATILKSRSAEASECPVLPVKSWADFKHFATLVEPYKFIFRGQPGQWRLRTAFHRTGRADLSRYLNRDIPALHRHLSAITKHPFDLRDPLQNAAFFNLVQHHGFPTPLLDWSYSPFVAAHFAFTPEPSGADGFVRIYVFNKVDWCAVFPQVQNTNTRRPHFSILEAIGIENQRMIPQQALSSFTNVDDVESYVRSVLPSREYLCAIDLPIAERFTVLKELRMMGITPGSMFPGLDGACAEFRERFFS